MRSWSCDNRRYIQKVNARLQLCVQVGLLTNFHTLLAGLLQAQQALNFQDLSPRLCQRLSTRWVGLSKPRERIWRAQ